MLRHPQLFRLKHIYRETGLLTSFIVSPLIVVSVGIVRKPVRKAPKKYKQAKIQITPPVPKRPIKTVTIKGPTKAESPDPKFNTDIAAPLFSGAKEGTNAVRGTYPASVAP